jgi:hypothetical protein
VSVSTHIDDNDDDLQAPAVPARQYPVADPGTSDPRFNLGLMVDVIKVLEDHGFPPIVGGADYVELQLALFQFIYRGEARR